MIANKHHGRKAREYHERLFNPFLSTTNLIAKTEDDFFAKRQKIWDDMRGQCGITEMMRGSGK
jgi:hypothetical protein